MVALGHHDIVERVPLARRLAAAEELGVHHAAHLDGRCAVAPGLQGGVELGERDFGKKAQRAQVHAEQRSVGVGEGARRGQQRPIAAEDDDEVRLARGHLLALDTVTIRLRCARLLCACSRSRALCALQIRRALAGPERSSIRARRATRAARAAPFPAHASAAWR